MFGYPPPSYLEPQPQFVVEPTSNLLFPLHLFTVLKETFIYPPTVQIPIPRRRSSLSRIIISPSPSSTSASSLADPMSPTMTAASASAAAAADHRNPGSHVAKSLLKSCNRLTTASDEVITYHHSTSSVHKKSNVDQSMFLTKNAHIKRPRNAWIHVNYKIILLVDSEINFFFFLL